MRRPHKLTPAVSKRIVDATRLGAPRAAAASAAGVGVSTLYRWMHDGRLASDSIEGRFVEALDNADAVAELELVTGRGASTSRPTGAR